MSIGSQNTANIDFQDEPDDRVVSIGLAEASFAEQPERKLSPVSTGLIRAGIGGAVVLLAVIGIFGLVGGFKQNEETANLPVVASKPKPPNLQSSNYQILVTNWTQAKKQYGIALASGRDQATTNRSDQARIAKQQQRTSAAETAVDQAGIAVAEALRVSSSARDKLDDLLGEKLKRKLVSAKEALNSSIINAEAAQKDMRIAEAEHKRIDATVNELRKAANAAKAAASAADVVVAAAKSARLVMAENEDIISDGNSSAMANLESGFFKEASQQAESAGRSALVASKAVAITELRLQQVTDRLKPSQVKFRQTNAAEEKAYLDFAAADKAFKLHTAQKAKAQDKSEVTSVALASAERRLEEMRDLLARETAALLSLRTSFSSGQQAGMAHEAKIATALGAFEKADTLLRSAQRIRSVQNAATLAALNADMHTQLRLALSNTQAVQASYDRFVLSSEALFEPGSARLGKTGRETIARITSIVEGVTGKVPEDMDWMLRVDGHTDATPLSGNGSFKDNWQLSQARALSVVKHLIKQSTIPARRMSANGFGEYQPISKGNGPAGQAANRRIEIVLTSR